MKRHSLSTCVLVLALLITLNPKANVAIAETLFTPITQSATVQTDEVNRPNFQGTVYYVDQNHPQADDDNPGSEASPWLTIQKAADTVDPGDTVYVKTGTYDERVLLNRGGTSTEKVTFKALPRRSVVMEGFQVYEEYIRIEGFEITNSSGGWDEGQGVFNREAHIEVVDNYFHDLSRTAIEGSTEGYIAYNDVYHCQKGMTANSGTVVEYNTVERLFDYGNGDVDYSRFFGEDIVFRGNRFQNTIRSEIGEAHLDCWQTFDNTTSSHNVLIEGNFCSGSSQVFMGSAENQNNTYNIVFRNNVFVGATSGCGALCMHNITNVTVFNNTFVDIVGGPGVNMRSESSGTVRNNIFYSSRSSYNGNTALVEGDYNIIYDCETTPENLGPNDLLDVDPMLVDPANNDFHLQIESPAIDGGQSLPEVEFDFDGNSRPQGDGWDIGAYEFAPSLVLHGIPGDETIHLNWTVNGVLPPTSTWTINYESPGSAYLPVTGILSPTRAYTLTGLTNGVWYTVTLHAMLDSTSLLSDTMHVMPTGSVVKFVYLPLVLK